MSSECLRWETLRPEPLVTRVSGTWPGRTDRSAPLLGGHWLVFLCVSCRSLQITDQRSLWTSELERWQKQDNNKVAITRLTSWRDLLAAIQTSPARNKEEQRSEPLRRAQGQGLLWASPALLQGTAGHQHLGWGPSARQRVGGRGQDSQDLDLARCPLVTMFPWTRALPSLSLWPHPHLLGWRGSGEIRPG